MSVYRETDGSIVREYTLGPGAILRKETEHSYVEVVPTEAFGKALFIDNELQLTEKDEYIYHEMLVHPCLASTEEIKKICVIGGGDGCALREILKWKHYNTIHEIDLIDYDRDVVDLFKHQFCEFNDGAYEDRLVHVENVDIRNLLHDTERYYDCIFVDLIDPSVEQAELWEDMLSLLKHWTIHGGNMVINAGGITPWQMEMVNWLVELLEEKFPHHYIHLYKAFIPSFGREWCYIFLHQNEKIKFLPYPEDLQYFSERTWKQAYNYGWTTDYLRQINLNMKHQIDEE